MTDDEKIAPPIKTTSLKKFLKDKEEMRAGGDAIDELIAEMEFISEAIWKQAARHAREDNRSTVKKRDIQEAYDELFEPHDLLMDVADRVGAMSREIENEAKRSPAFPELSPNDE